MQLSLKCFLFVLFKKIVCISIKPFFPPASFSGYSLFNSMKPICQLFIITLQQQDKKVTNSPHLSCALTYFYFFPSNHTESFKPFSLSNVLFSWLPWQLVLLFFSLFLDLLFFFFFNSLVPEVLSLPLSFFYCSLVLPKSYSFFKVPSICHLLYSGEDHRS